MTTQTEYEIARGNPYFTGEMIEIETRWPGGDSGGVEYIGLDDNGDAWMFCANPHFGPYKVVSRNVDTTPGEIVSRALETGILHIGSSGAPYSGLSIYTDPKWDDYFNGQDRNPVGFFHHSKRVPPASHWTVPVRRIGAPPKTG